MAQGEYGNGDGPKWDCTNLEQRAVISFLWAEGVIPADVRWSFVAHYGSGNCISQRNVYEWVKTFKSGRTSVCDEARLERLSVSRAQEHVVCAAALMQDDTITVCVCSCCDARHTDGNLQFTTEEDCRQNCSFASQFSPPMVRSQEQRQFETSSWRFCHIHLAVPTSHHATFIPLFHVKALRGRGFGSVKK